MLKVKSNTYLGRQLVKRGQQYEGKFLNQVYDSWSSAKQNAWDNCYQMCINEKGEEFSIISHNSFGFSVSWFTNDGMRIETPKNSYLVEFVD